MGGNFPLHQCKSTHTEVDKAAVIIRLLDWMTEKSTSKDTIQWL